MSERWEREVRRLREVEPSSGLWEDAKGRTPDREGTDDGFPSTRQRLIAGVAAFAIFIAGGALAWRAFQPAEQQPPPIVAVDSGHALIVSISEPDGAVHFPFLEDEPRPEMTVTFDGVSLDATPISYTWCEEAGVNCRSAESDYDITFFQPVPAATTVVVEGEANEVHGSFHRWRGDGPTSPMTTVPEVPGLYELLVDATFDRGQVEFSVGVEVVDEALPPDLERRLGIYEAMIRHLADPGESGPIYVSAELCSMLSSADVGQPCEERLRRAEQQHLVSRLADLGSVRFVDEEGSRQVPRILLGPIVETADGLRVEGGSICGGLCGSGRMYIVVPRGVGYAVSGTDDSYGRWIA